MALNWLVGHNAIGSENDVMARELVPSLRKSFKLECFRGQIVTRSGDHCRRLTIDRKKAGGIRFGWSNNYSHTVVSQLTGLYRDPSEFRSGGRTAVAREFC